MGNSNKSKLGVDVFSLIVGLCALLEEVSLCVCVFTKGGKTTLFI